MPPTKLERTTAAVITDGCVACRGKGRADLTFRFAVHYADAVVWDRKRRFIKHVLNLRKSEREGGDLRATGSKGKQHWNGLNVIYCNDNSSRGALRLRGLIKSLGVGEINKVSFIFQGAPGLSVTILSPPQEPSTLISLLPDNNTSPPVSELPATALSFSACCFAGL